MLMLSSVPSRRLVWTTVFLLLFAAFLFGQEAGLRLEPMTAVRMAGFLSEPLPLDAFVEIALLVSGSSLDEIPSLAERAIAEAMRAADGTASMKNDYERAETLLLLLHDGTLKAYVEKETRYDVLIKSGLFNCVSSSVAYAVYLKASGLKVLGVQTKDHAFCSVETSRGMIDVETTNREGFDPGTKKEFTDSFGKVTGFSYVPEKNYAGRTSIGEKTLLALILSNRISELERNRHWSEAIPLAIDRNALLMTHESLGFLVDRIVNYSGDLVNRKKFREALDFLDRVSVKFGKQVKFLDTVDIAIRNALADYVSRKKWDEGYAFLSTMRARYGDFPQFAEFEKVSNHNRVVEWCASYDFAKADDLISRIGNPQERASLKIILDQSEYSHAVLKLGFSQGVVKITALFSASRITSKQVEEAFAYLYGKEAEKIARAEGWLRGAVVFDGALAVLPGNPTLLKARSGYVSNYAVDVHNRFAALWNLGKTMEAEALLREGLNVAPENSILRKDFETLRLSGTP